MSLPAGAGIPSKRPRRSTPCVSHIETMAPPASSGPPPGIRRHRPRPRTTATILVVVATAVLVTGCGGGAGLVPGTGRPDVPGAAHPREVRAVSTAPRLVPTRTALATAPTEWSSVLFDLHERWLSCTHDPGRCDANDFAVPGGSAHSWFTDVFGSWARHGRRVAVTTSAAPPTLQSARRLGDARSRLVWCWVDDLVVVTDPPEGRSTPVILDDSVVTMRWRWDLEMNHGAWQIAQAEVLDAQIGVGPWCA